jgi:signal peptidase I
MTLKKDTGAFLDVTGYLLASGCRVRFCAQGASMRPAIRDGDNVEVETIEPEAVKRGDILLYRQHHRPVAHRVVTVQRDGNQVVGFVLRGDAKRACDAPVKPHEVVGRVVVRDASIVRRLLSYLRHHLVAPRATRHK